MSDLNWISAATTHRLASVVSKSRTDFGMEASSRSSLFCGAATATVKMLDDGTANDTRSGAGCARPARGDTALRRVFSLLRRWLERAHSRRQLCELDDHILQDIGLTRDAVRREATRPFWR